MSNKMSDVFDLPVGDSEFTLVAMAKSTYMSMDKAAVIAINAYDANQDRIAELEKEKERLTQHYDMWKGQWHELNNRLPLLKLEQQAKGVNNFANKFCGDATTSYQVQLTIDAHCWCEMLGRKALKEQE
jgi:hypothetical protein